jgi:hypothetical protein
MSYFKRVLSCWYESSDVSSWAKITEKIEKTFFWFGFRIHRILHTWVRATSGDFGISGISWTSSSYKARPRFRRPFWKHGVSSLSMISRQLLSHESDGSLGSLKTMETTLPNNVTWKIFYSAELEIRGYHVLPRDPIDRSGPISIIRLRPSEKNLHPWYKLHSQISTENGKDSVCLRDSTMSRSAVRNRERWSAGCGQMGILLQPTTRYVAIPFVSFPRFSSHQAVFLMLGSVGLRGSWRAAGCLGWPRMLWCITALCKSVRFKHCTAISAALTSFAWTVSCSSISSWVTHFYP